MTKHSTLSSRISSAYWLRRKDLNTKIQWQVTIPPQAFSYSPSSQEMPPGIKQKGGIQRGGVLAQVFFHLPRGRLHIPEQEGVERCQDHHQAFGSFPPSNDWFYSRGFSKTIWNLWLNPHPSSLPKGPQSHPPNDHHHFSSVFGCKMNPTSSHRRSERKREWAYTGISYTQNPTNYFSPPTNPLPSMKHFHLSPGFLQHP